MSTFDVLAARNFECDERGLVVGGVALSAIAERVGTPAFVYDAATIDRRVATLRETLPGFDPYYSIKANPNGAILRRFLHHGFGLEVASLGEFRQACAAGCDPARILFAGPGKTDAELEAVVAAAIGEIHVESFEEIDRLGAIARRAGRGVHVAVRVNPGGEVEGGAMRMGGRAAAFGIDEELLDDAVDRVAGTESLTFSGVHLFTGTQILDADTLVRQYRRGLELAVRAGQRAGKPVATLDFGGGLGIPYHPGDETLDTGAFGDGVRDALAEFADHPALRGTRFVVEPGRWLVGESGIYVARVVGVKTSRGKRFVITDGGMHHHLAASGNLGQVLKRNFPVALASRTSTAPDAPAEVAGPLCTPLDVLARNHAMPEDVAPGDLVAVLQSGAYARAASPLGFLSHPAPPEAWVEDGEIRLIRRRATHDAPLADQCDEPLGDR